VLPDSQSPNITEDGTVIMQATPSNGTLSARFPTLGQSIIRSDYSPCQGMKRASTAFSR
jgi:hypothetical protein